MRVVANFSSSRRRCKGKFSSSVPYADSFHIQIRTFQQQQQQKHGINRVDWMRIS